MEVVLVMALVALLVVLPVLALVVALRTRSQLHQLRDELAATRVGAAGITPPPAPTPLPLADAGARPVSAGWLARLRARVAPDWPPTPGVNPPGASAGPKEAPHSAVGRPRREVKDVEATLGGTVLNRAGAVALVAGFVFLLKHAFDHNWIGPTGRVALGLLAGLAMAAAGLVLQRRGRAVFAQGITGAGLAILFATLYVAHGLYGLIPGIAALAAMIAVTIAGAFVAIAMRSQAVAVVALVGGYASPLLAGGGQSALGLAGYLICVSLMGLALGTRQGWAWLDAVALGGTNLAWARWADLEYRGDRFGSVWGAQALTFLLFASTPYARRWPRRARFLPSDLVLWVGAALGFFLWSAWLLREEHRRGLGWVCAALALFYLTQALLVRSRASALSPADASGDRHASAGLAFQTLLLVALAFAVIAIPAELDRVAVTFAWAVQANVLLWLGLRSGIRWIKTASLVVLATDLWHMVVIDFPALSAPSHPGIVGYTIVLLLSAAGYAWAGWLAHRAGLRVFGIPLGRWLRIAGGIAALLVITVALDEYGRRMRLSAGEDMGRIRTAVRESQAAISIAWALYAAAASALGFLRGSAAARWFGLSVFALLMIKLLLVDLASLAAIYRVASLLVAAVALLSVSWLYTRRGRTERAG